LPRPGWTGTFWWLFISMHTYGGLAAPLAALAVLGAGGLSGAVLRGYLRLLWRLGPAASGCVGRYCFCSLLVAGRAGAGIWLTGFPWGAGGYAHVDGLLAGWRPGSGVYGLGAVAAWLAAMLP
jgi:apolipoprotein N-acyltransferase